MDRKLVEVADQLNSGSITRREFMRRAVLITGSWAAAMSALQACAPAQPTPTPAPLAEPTPAQAASSPTAAPVVAPTAVPGVKTGGTFISAKTAEVPSLDPQVDATLSRQRMFMLLYSNLVKLGPDLSIQPDLAESWEIKDDGKRIDFKLRQGVKWHPPVSRELDADDVRFSYSRLLKESPGKSEFVAIEDIEVVDKYTVAFHLSQPSAALLASMAGVWGGIVCREAVEKYGDLRKDAVGTGPFILDQWNIDAEMRLRKNPDYFLTGRPLVDQVVLKIIPEEASIVAALRSNTIHHALLEDNKNFDLLKDEKSLTAYRGSRLGFDFLNINHSVPPFDKPQVAQALSWAIDREEMIKVVTQGYAKLTPPLTPPMKMWQLEEDKWLPFYKVDLDKAKRLLAEAGVANGFKTTVLVVPTFPTMVAGAQVMQANLKRIDVDVEIQSLEYGMWTKRVQSNDFTLLMNIHPGGADPDGVLYRLLHSKGANRNNWSDPESDGLLDQGRATFDFAQRKTIYDQEQRLLLERVPQIWFFCPDMIEFTQNYIRGFTQHPTTFLWGFDEVWLDN